MRTLQQNAKERISESAVAVQVEEVFPGILDQTKRADKYEMKCTHQYIHQSFRRSFFLDSMSLKQRYPG